MNKTIKDLQMHCGECTLEIFNLCDLFCNLKDNKTALCVQPRFINLDINKENIEKIEEILKKEN